MEETDIVQQFSTTFKPQDGAFVLFYLVREGFDVKVRVMLGPSEPDSDLTELKWKKK